MVGCCVFLGRQRQERITQFFPILDVWLINREAVDDEVEAFLRAKIVGLNTVIAVGRL